MSESIGALRSLVDTAEGEISREIFVNKKSTSRKRSIFSAGPGFTSVTKAR